MNTKEIVEKALKEHTAIPAFNIPYLPMMEPIIRAVRDTNSFAFVDVARLEWIKFESGGPRQVRDEYLRWADTDHTRLHLDHIPVIDEDNVRVDYLPIITEALDLGYDSVMIDGSRLSLQENIEATAAVCAQAHVRGVPVEGELGAVLGHEAGPLPPYEELYASGKGFTDPDEAVQFVEATGVDWLSIAFGNIHGPISAVERQKEKTHARLNIDHLREIQRRIGIPIVLHGGSGIVRDNVLQAIQNGVAKINVASDLRRPYEALMSDQPDEARDAVYEATRETIIKLELRDTRNILFSKGD
ncbi:MAG: class II fructose-bisphosphate aldolase [Alkalispirochaeta sp.]